MSMLGGGETQRQLVADIVEDALEDLWSAKFDRVARAVVQCIGHEDLVRALVPRLVGVQAYDELLRVDVLGYLACPPQHLGERPVGGASSGEHPRVGRDEPAVQVGVVAALERDSEHVCHAKARRWLPRRCQSRPAREPRRPASGRGTGLRHDAAVTHPDQREPGAEVVVHLDNLRLLVDLQRDGAETVVGWAPSTADG